MSTLTGKTAIITGAAGGIGRASALEFASRGARVLAVDLDQAGVETTAELVRTAGGTIGTFVGDVSEEATAEAYVAEATRLFGPVDILFNNAGVEFHNDLVDTTAERFDREFDINVRSVFLGMRAVLPSMYERRSGAIVSTSSVNGWVGNAGNAVYAATKHAIIGLTKAVAVEAGRYGVRVNAICPGTTRTGMLERFADADTLQKLAAGSVPLQRISDPAEQARVACFLASDEASYITGTAVLVDGGMVNALMV